MIPTCVSNQPAILYPTKNGTAATTAGNILVEMVKKSRCPYPVLNRAKLYAAGSATAMARIVLTMQMMAVFPISWKKGVLWNNRPKFVRVGRKKKSFMKSRLKISWDPLKEVIYIHKIGNTKIKRTMNTAKVKRIRLIFHHPKAETLTH
jgi:hypothetical protein